MPEYLIEFTDYQSTMENPGEYIVERRVVSYEAESAAEAAALLRRAYSPENPVILSMLKVRS